MSGQTGSHGRVERGHAESDDGWSIVPRSKRTKAANVSDRLARPTKTVDGLTIEELLNELKDMEARWNKTSCAKSIEKMLGIRDWSVKNAVCIGIGSFSLDWEHRYRSMWQLLLFMTVVKLLQHDTAALTLYAQEPVFTTLDISFLGALDIAVLPSNIDTHTTPSSFVFAPFVDWYILLPLFLQGKDPELYIGNEILRDYRSFANTQEKEKVLAECNELGKKFAEKRERRRVPDFELHTHALNGLMMYWKEEEDE